MNTPSARNIRDRPRCPWPIANHSLYLKYHDQEWGVPVRRDGKIFEFLILEAFQAGLSWRTILEKRENFRRAFAGFDVKKVSQYGARDIARLMNDVGIIRNRAKILAAINNAKRFLEVRKEFGSFSRYMWSQVKGRPLRHRFKSMRDFPQTSPEAISWSKDLKKRGFSFLGPITLYSHMQAVGMVNDHIVNCFRHRELAILSHSERG